MLVQFTTAATADDPVPHILEADLQCLPRVGDNLIFDADERDDGEPVEYTVKRVSWVVVSSGAEAVVTLGR